MRKDGGVEAHSPENRKMRIENEGDLPHGRTPSSDLGVVPVFPEMRRGRVEASNLHLHISS